MSLERGFSQHGDKSSLNGVTTATRQCFFFLFFYSLHSLFFLFFSSLSLFFLFLFFVFFFVPPTVGSFTARLPSIGDVAFVCPRIVKRRRSIWLCRHGHVLGHTHKTHRGHPTCQRRPRKPKKEPTKKKKEGEEEKAAAAARVATLSLTFTPSLQCGVFQG